MGVPFTQASLNTVRQDLDLPAAGSILERPVMNKINKDAGPINLADYKGNLLGTQLTLDPSAWVGSNLVWKKFRYHATSHYYVSSYGGDVRVVNGNQYRLRAKETGGGGGDRGSEVRFMGKVTEAGEYRLTGTMQCNGASSYYTTQRHINLIANSSDYLQGINDIKVRSEASVIGSQSVQNYQSPIFTLDTNRPFITLILRNVMVEGGNLSTYEHYFWNWKCERVA